MNNINVDDSLLQRIKDIPMPSFLDGFEMQGYYYVCPFCGSGNGKNKSSAFRIFDNKFKCFSCGWSGDGIDLVSELNSLNFIESVKKICDDFGIHYEGNCKIDKYPVLIQVDILFEPIYKSIDRLKIRMTRSEYNLFINSLHSFNKFEKIAMEIRRSEILSKNPKSNKSDNDVKFDCYSRVWDKRAKNAKSIIEILSKSKASKINHGTYNWSCIATWLSLGYANKLWNKSHGSNSEVKNEK